MLKNYKNSKAFTFAELLISLVIIAVITVILYPTIADLAPNNNRYLFKSTYKTIETIVSEISTTSEIPFYTADNNNVPSEAIAVACMCHEFEDRLNTTFPSNGTGCAPTGATKCPNGRAYITTNGGNNTFVSTNGVRWAFKYHPNDAAVSPANTPTIEILVDINASNNAMGNTKNITDTNPQPIGWGNNMDDIWIDTKQGALGARGIYYTSDKITQDTFLIKVHATGESAGKITIASTVGYSHLQDQD